MIAIRSDPFCVVMEPSIESRINMDAKQGVLFRVLSWLKSSPKPLAHLKHPDLYELSDEGLAKDLRIREEAARLGALKLPAADEKNLSAIESQVYHRIEKARLDFVDWASNRILVLNENMSRLDVAPTVSRARQADQEFQRKCSTVLDDEASALRVKWDSVQSAKTEMDDFKQKHALAREPRFPRGASYFFCISFLIFMIAAEGVANAYFFAEGSSLGLVGGFISAGGAAALNVCFSAMVGRFILPFAWYRNALIRVVMIPVLLISLTVMGCIGLMISHYREALVLDADTPGQLALQTFIRSTFDLQDMASWALYGVSLLFAIFALFDGLKLNDPYPFYGAHQKRLDKAIKVYECLALDLRDELEGLKDEALNELKRDVEHVRSIITRQLSQVEKKTEGQARLTTALANAEHCMGFLLALFRQENAAERQGHPVPSTFSYLPTLTSLTLPDFAIASDRNYIEAQERLVAELEERLQSIRAAIQAAYNREYDRLNPLMQQLGGTAKAPIVEVA